MLDTQTKRRIDTARDILVGKVPDPKSQVEQITIALIYKFMDDMDAEAEELGGSRKFFAKDFAKYGWAKIMRGGLGGHEMLGLYAEGITQMPQNPGVPKLFRDIFKNAFLPYRDPETLKQFLKIIDEFSYDHSERLGDAFEYLLSVLGSQGDAGQFRTPRHIIDFIVEVIAPKKNERILDPACGTAGFLISAYKHIVNANRDKAGQNNLTPDEREALARNVRGYDISPDMVRLSLANLYLHGFTDPQVLEYDSLTSEERWDETYDVILANPPFMSPKGGIKPHKRFSIQAKRSEVLFVDYIAEHLAPTGRAGIIVPEGIIFQSQNAYKDLRKMLVEQSLVAVISLPAGCFNPYSGVKTSILILDKSLAKQSQTIAFFKVENDGFGLGAQRRVVAQNDLPLVKVELDAYLNACLTRKSTDELVTTRGLIVAKVKIAANGDYNLSGERYRVGAAQAGGFPWIKIEFLVETVTPPSKIQKTAFGSSGKFPIIDQSQDRIAGWTDDETMLIHPMKPLVIFGDHTCAVKLIEKPFAQGADGIKTLQTIEDLNPLFLYQILRARPLESAGYQRHYSLLKEMEIPLPPIDVQKEIVAEIEGYQKVIDGARAVVDNYRPHIPINPDWPLVELGDVCNAIITGPFGSALHQSDYVEEGIPVINPANIVDGWITTDGVKMVSMFTRDRLQEFTISQGDILIGRRGEMGRCGLVTQDMNGWLCGTGCFVIRLGDSCDSSFALLHIASPSVKQYLEQQAIGVTMKNLNQGILTAIQLPLPPLATQQAIVAEIEAEQALVNANRKLITHFEKKIQVTLARVWGEDVPSVEPDAVHIAAFKKSTSSKDARFNDKTPEKAHV